MTGDYQGPAFSKGKSHLNKDKRSFNRALAKHQMISDHSLEQPAFHKHQRLKQFNQQVDQKPQSLLQQRSSNGDSASSLFYQPVSGHSDSQDRLAKAQQAMRSWQDQAAEEELLLPSRGQADYEVPFLKKAGIASARSLKRTVDLAFDEEKDYNNSLSTNHQPTDDSVHGSIQERLFNIDHSLSTINQLQGNHLKNQQSQQVSRAVLRRLAKKAESFLLFNEEDNENVN